MQNSVVETLIGAAGDRGRGAVLSSPIPARARARFPGYEVSAKFNRADGVNVGTDVRMSGIKIGTVSRLGLDPKTYNAVVTLSLENSVKLPDDSSVRITSDGLLGNQYLSVEPGGSQSPIKPGGEIENTQGAIDLMGLLGKVMFGAGSTTGGAK